MPRNFQVLNAPCAAIATFLFLWIFVATSQGQVSWTTTKTTINSHDRGGCALAQNSLKVKVFPATLDVEEEAQIGVTGAVRPGNDPNTLEIEGRFTLPPGAALIGALLWDGNRILEGKLLDRKRADSLYEGVVQRDSIIPPVRPRDPILLEFLGNNTYRFKIYPVALNFTRRMRLRYQLPPQLGPDGFEMRLQAAIAPLFPTAPNVAATLVSGVGTDAVLLAEGSVKRQLTLPRSVFLAPSNLGQYTSSPIRILPTVRADQVMAKTSFDAGYFKGHYANTYAAVPQALLVPAGGRTRTVSVTVRNAGKAYDLPIACQATPSIQCGNFLFNGKSAQAWNDTLEWQAFDAEGRLLHRVRLRPKVLGGEGDTGLAVTWAATLGRFSELKELPAGPVYGFADAWASILALEKDSLVGDRRLAYVDSGVPRIRNANINDVIENYNGQVPPCCGNPTPIIASKPVLADATSWRVERERGGILALRIPGLVSGMLVELTLFDLSGRGLGTWKIGAEEGVLRWDVAGIHSGTYLLQIRASGMQGVKKVVL